MQVKCFAPDIRVAVREADLAISKAAKSSKRVVQRGVGVVVGTLTPMLAFATEEGIDVSEVVTAITGHGAILVTIGAAVLGVLYLARVFSWARKI